MNIKMSITIFGNHFELKNSKFYYFKMKYRSFTELFEKTGFLPVVLMGFIFLGFNRIGWISFR